MIAVYAGTTVRTAEVSTHTAYKPDPRIIVPPYGKDVRKSFVDANVRWLTQFYADHPEFTPGVAV